MTLSPRPAPPPPRPRFAAWALVVLVLAPIVYTLARAVAAGRNVAYVDDIDGPLMLLIRLQAGGSWADFGQWMFEIANEHRMVTSRLIVAASYWLTGTVDFAVLGAIGNLFVCALCVLLIATAGSVERRWGMAVVLAGALFQLEHFENFFWGGSSIDHFQVPLLAGGTVVLLARRGAWAVLGAGVLAALATFTLAHGLVLWPVGVAMLALDRRWRQLAWWSAIGIGAGVAYFSTFQFNSAHRIEVLSVAGTVRIVRFWFELLGAPLALGEKNAARVLGVVLVAWLGWLGWRGAARRERIALSLAVWALGSLGLVAIVRANLGEGALSSRYYVLGALAWALVVFMAQPWSGERPRRLRWATTTMLAVAAFNVAANLKFAGEAERWVARRDRAAADFAQHGRDGAGPASLHPLPEHATRVIRQAEKLGVFRMPQQADEVSCPPAAPGKFANAVDRIAVDERMVRIEGWAASTGRVARPGDVKVVLRSAAGEKVLSTVGVTRPDVAAAFPGERWSGAGFRLELRRWLLPPENYQVGLLLPAEHGAEVVMTPQRLELGDSATMIERDKVAPSRIVYDERVLASATESLTAAPRKPMRATFLDTQGNLVHVDLTGAGVMTIELAGAVPLEPPLRHRGRPVARVQGHATIAIEEADETTHLSIFAARQRPAVEGATGGPRPGDGRAHLALLSISSRNGRCGAVRAGNACFSAEDGYTGLSAPGVRFAGPVAIGEIGATREGKPLLVVGAAREVRIVGGDLRQENGRPVQVAGFDRLQFLAGATAHGVRLPGQINRGVLVRGGVDVSGQLAWDRRRTGQSPGEMTLAEMQGTATPRRPRGSATD